MNSDSLQIIQLIMSGVALPLLGWVLREVIHQGRQAVVHSTWRELHIKENADMHTRIIACETQLVQIKIELEKLRKR